MVTSRHRLLGPGRGFLLLVKQSPMDPLLGGSLPSGHSKIGAPVYKYIKFSVCVCATFNVFSSGGQTYWSRERGLCLKSRADLMIYLNMGMHVRQHMHPSSYHRWRRELYRAANGFMTQPSSHGQTYCAKCWFHLGWPGCCSDVCDCNILKNDHSDCMWRTNNHCSYLARELTGNAKTHL